MHRIFLRGALAPVRAPLTIFQSHRPSRAKLVRHSYIGIGMGEKKNDILQGTLVLLILKTLASNKRLHGYAITAHIQQVSKELLRVEEGSLYPALHRDRKS